MSKRSRQRAISCDIQEAIEFKWAILKIDKQNCKSNGS